MANVNQTRISQPSITYVERFREAKERTLSWGIAEAVPNETEKKFLSGTVIKKVETWAKKEFRHIPHEAFVGQCMSMTDIAKRDLEHLLDLPLTYTLGCVDLGKGIVFHTPIDELKRIYENRRYDSRGIELHAWLTLPSMEIIDLTLLTTVGCVVGGRQYLGEIIFADPSKRLVVQGHPIISEITYYPQVLGLKCLEDIGLVLNF